MRDPNDADRLLRWMAEAAYPLWADRGVDRVRGGFHEALTPDGRPADLPRRARVQPRQAIAFAAAPALGWNGDAAGLVRHGLDYVDAVFTRDDGLLRTLVDPSGTPLDEEAVLYDHCFALLARARAFELDDDGTHADRALGMLDALERRFRVARDRGFHSRENAPLPLLANPHMHLFEAALGWAELDGGARWEALADEIAALALAHMIDGRTGALGEVFDIDWFRVPGLDGRLVEPGHQYEWAWLLLRWGARRDRADAITAAIRLIDHAERHGICPDRGVGYEAILDDNTVHAAVGRTWPQTERIKAGLRARAVTGDARFGDVAARGTASLLRFLDTDRPGLWHDRLLADGRWGTDAVPASTFYHIVYAAEETLRFREDGGSGRRDGVSTAPDGTRATG